MKYYSLSIDISQRKCVVIGGGKVALRKVRKLCEAGAHVTVQSIDFLHEFSELEGANKMLTLLQSSYTKEVLEGACLIFAATSNFEVNQQICSDARELDIPVNSVNGASYGSFIIPATCSNDILGIGITTEGLAPSLSKHLRRYLQQKLAGIEDGRISDIVALRKQMVIAEDEQEKAEIEQQIEKQVAKVIAEIELERSEIKA